MLYSLPSLNIRCNNITVIISCITTAVFLIFMKFWRTRFLCTVLLLIADRCCGVWLGVSACYCTTSCLNSASNCLGSALLVLCSAHMSTRSSRLGTLPELCGLKRYRIDFVKFPNLLIDKLIICSHFYKNTLNNVKMEKT